VAFNGEVKKIEKDGKNPHFKSDYATLDNIIDVTRPILHKHGLTVMQFPGGDGEKVTVRTMVMHESGEWIESEPLTIKPTKVDPQGAGSAITYARRYSYAAALSLSLGDDDDGNSASAPQTPAQTQQSQRTQQPQGKQQNASQQAIGANSGYSNGISQAQINYVHKLKADKHIPEHDYARMVNEIGKGKTSIKEFTKGEASEIINLLNNYAVQEYQAPEMDELPF